MFFPVPDTSILTYLLNCTDRETTTTASQHHHHNIDKDNKSKSIRTLSIEFDNAVSSAVNCVFCSVKTLCCSEFSDISCIQPTITAVSTVNWLSAVYIGLSSRTHHCSMVSFSVPIILVSSVHTVHTVDETGFPPVFDGMLTTCFWFDWLIIHIWNYQTAQRSTAFSHLHTTIMFPTSVASLTH